MMVERSRALENVVASTDVWIKVEKVENRPLGMGYWNSATATRERFGVECV
jgi:hypothetical protein